jgi:fused signal recognition particle receptor
MFSFFKKKPPADAAATPAADAPAAASSDVVAPAAQPPVASTEPSEQPAPAPAPAPARTWREKLGFGNAPTPTPPPQQVSAEEPVVEPAIEAVSQKNVEQAEQVDPIAAAAPASPAPPETTDVDTPPPERKNWLAKLRTGLRRTGSSIAQVFTGAQIDDALYEELEDALLMADTGVKATEFLLADLKRRVKEARVTEPAAVKGLLADAVTDLLRPLEKQLTIGEATPTVMMVVGVNGAGKTTSIGKLTRHLAEAGEKVLLAAADTFRAAAREQLAVWAGRNNVEIVSQEGGDPSAVTFDAVVAGKARSCSVVIADTAGRLPTQLHLMEELKKIKRSITKAQAGAPHEVLLVVDGNTGQNALSQVKSFDDALALTGLVVTKLDGTAKGERPVPVYFVGVGEKLEDLETFDAREFANALLG